MVTWMTHKNLVWFNTLNLTNNNCEFLLTASVCIWARITVKHWAQLCGRYWCSKVSMGVCSVPSNLRSWKQLDQSVPLLSMCEVRWFSQHATDSGQSLNSVYSMSAGHTHFRRRVITMSTQVRLWELSRVRCIYLLVHAVFYLFKVNFNIIHLVKYRFFTWNIAVESWVEVLAGLLVTLPHYLRFSSAHQRKYLDNTSNQNPTVSYYILTN